MPGLVSPPARRIVVPSVCLGLLLFFSSPSHAQNIIHVPGDQATIQAAINAAGNGDTVLVAPGTYTENISFLGKNITVTSSGGPAVTTIDGGGSGSVVTFTGGETNSAVLSGFTIQDGSTYYAAGGVQVTNASPTIMGNVITGNHAPSGLGIYINGGSPIIKNNTITGNTQIGSSGGGGGGIYASGSNTSPGAPLITGNTITNNSVANGGNGGGILADYFSTPTIEGNLIEGNSAYNDGGGVAIRTYGASIVVQNIITNNTSGGGGSGAGVYAFASSEMPADIFANNTIANNSAFDRSSGIFVGGFAQMITFTNNVIVATTGENSVTCDATYSSISSKFSHNDAFSLSGAGWTGICDTTTLPGNISVDPQFVNAANGDFHLGATSPVIDAGDNGATNLPPSDYDGNPRILDGRNSCVNTVDLGAYEVVKTIAANLSPLSLTFGSQVIGTTSSAQSVTFASTGQTCFQYSAPQISGDFTQTNNCPPGGLPGGTACTFSVSFTPTAAGPRSGSLSVSGNGSNLAVALSGSGATPPSVTLSPVSLAFPNQVIGTVSSPMPVSLTNTGGATLSIQGITVTGSFLQTNNCPAGLTAGASCTVNVTFAPSAAGNQTGTLSVSDNASGSPQTVSVSGVGTTLPVATVSPVNLAFPNQIIGTVSSPMPVSVTNTGSGTLMIQGIAASGSFLQTNNCPAGLTAGASCTVNVTFAPSAPGNQSGTLSVSDNASNSPQAVSLSGAGVDFSINASPTNPSVAKGNSVSVTVTVSSVGGAFGNPVVLSCSGLPAQSACSFSPANPTPGNSAVTSVMTVTTRGSTPTGTFAVTITGASGPLQHSRQVMLTVRKH